MQKLIQCVPNFSEGRRQEVIDQVAGVVKGVEGVRLLDISPNPDHNRTVLTFVGPPDAVAEAAFAATAEAVKLIDMEKQKGEHPRIGAMDVVPFIPISGMTMQEAVEIANQVGKRIAEELGVPVYLYSAAASTPARKKLPDVRQGQYEGLKESISTPERKPDYGEPKMHPTAGATAVGARPPLIAFNVNLGTTNLQIAKDIARGLRESSGGLMNVQALGVDLAAEGLSQVSMNLLDYTKTPIHRAYELVRVEAERYGVPVVGSEIVGLVPLDAMVGLVDFYLRLKGFSRSQVLEARLLEEE
ncbi:MAG TPA: glutamate formimidoyltransferase [Chloroflexia bacterium]|nr:glutamate formimidoyltransferase [Chloroflexia bacterium]